MLENLKLLLDELQHNPDCCLSRGNHQDVSFSLECAIEILDKIKYEERSLQNGKIE